VGSELKSASAAAAAATPPPQTPSCRADPFCEEALSALVDNHLLTNAQELELVDRLPLAPEDRWLALLYRAKCKKVCLCVWGGVRQSVCWLQQGPPLASFGSLLSSYGPNACCLAP
jgi:hypothetical protein